MTEKPEIVVMNGEDEVLAKICKALDDPTWDFRSIEGLSAEIGLPEQSIRQKLEMHPSIFRKSPLPDKLGRSLYTLMSHPIRWQERLAVFQSALGGKFSS